jgi:3-oxoacyl-[acyl-carrier-protein] synthase II
MIANEVVITGIGVILPNCDSREQLWKHLRDGESQLRLHPNPADESDIRAMGRITEFNPGQYLHEFPERFYTRYPRETQFYLASVLLARNDAALAPDSIAADRIGLFDGTSRGNFEFWYDRIRGEREHPSRELYTRVELALSTPGQTLGLAAALLQIRGPTYTFNSSCCSGAIAIGHAYREIRAGEIDVAFATGHDTALVAPVYHMYGDAGLLSAERGDPRRAVRPYVDHSTNAFGEGAVSLVLESRAHAERRGARILATIGGYKYGNSGDHPTHVDVSGDRPAQVIGALLDTAQVTPSQVQFVVGHGNGVQSSDIAEMNYMRQLFGPRTGSVPLISTKPIYGHMLGAASALNVAAGALMIHHQYLMPTINVDIERGPAGMNFQANQGAPSSCQAGIATAFGLGGHNVALLLRRPAERNNHATRSE